MQYLLKGRLSPFVRLLTSEALNTTSSSILFIAAPLVAITALDADSFDVGLVAAAGSAAPLLFGLSAGALADRLERGRVLFWCGVARLLLVATIPILFLVDGMSVMALCIVGFGLSAAKLMFDSVVVAVIPTIVSRSTLTKANSWYEAFNSAADTLGPALAGWLLQTLSAATVYSVNAALYLTSTLFLRGVSLPARSRQVGPSKSHLADIAEGIKLLWRNKIQRTIALAAGFFNLFHTAFLTVFTFFALNNLGFSAASFGTVVSLVGFFGLFGALCAPRLIQMLGPRVALVGSLLVIGPLGIPILFVEGLPFLHRAAVIAMCLAAWDFMIVVHVIIEQTIRQVMVDGNQLSRITATTRFVSWGADPIGALLGGFAASSAIGVRGALFVCLVGFVASGALLLASKGIRHLRSPDLDFRDRDIVSQ